MAFDFGPIGGGFRFGGMGEDNPTYGFSQYLNMFDSTNPMRDWLSKNYGQINQDYLGQYMEALSSNNPTPSWLSYLQNYNPGNAYSYASPYERGERPTQFTGRTRSIY